jgi:hypothetical protein
MALLQAGHPLLQHQQHTTDRQQQQQQPWHLLALAVCQQGRPVN